MDTALYTFYVDSGHAWLQVTLAEIKRLDVQGISGFSYISGLHAYLEEDVDAGLFLQKKKEAGEAYTTEENYQERSFVRGLRAYTPLYLNHKATA